MENRQKLYKSRAINAKDAREVRVQTRAIERRVLRDKTYNKFRQLPDERVAVDPLKDQLRKWQEEKALKRDKAGQSRKPIFQMRQLKQNDVGLYKSMSPAQKKMIRNAKHQTQQSPRVTRGATHRAAILKNNKTPSKKALGRARISNRVPVNSPVEIKKPTGRVTRSRATKTVGPALPLPVRSQRNKGEHITVRVQDANLQFAYDGSPNFTFKKTVSTPSKIAFLGGRYSTPVGAKEDINLLDFSAISTIGLPKKQPDHVCETDPSANLLPQLHATASNSTLLMESVMSEKNDEPNVQVQVDDKDNKVEEKIPECSLLRTPRTVTKTAQRRRASELIAQCKSGKRTPKGLQRSFVLRHLSPDESVEVLKMSPMVELSRRKPRISVCSLELDLFADDDMEISDPKDSQPEGSKLATMSITNTSIANISTMPNKEIEMMIDEPAKPEKTNEVVVEKSDETAPDIPYFRRMLTENTQELNAVATEWEAILSASKLNEEDEGEVRATIGKAQLLVKDKFKQFRGLVDNCEFNTGDRVTTREDLQGFWEMVFIQVGQVHDMFVKLHKLRANDWKREVKVMVPKKRLIKKKPVTSKAPASKPKASSGLAAFLKKKKQDQQQQEPQEAVNVTEVVPVEIPAPAEPIPIPTVLQPEETNVPKCNTPHLHHYHRLTDGQDEEHGHTPKSLDRRSLNPALACSPLMRNIIARTLRHSNSASKPPKPLPALDRVLSSPKAGISRDIVSTPTREGPYAESNFRTPAQNAASEAYSPNDSPWTELSCVNKLYTTAMPNTPTIPAADVSLVFDSPADTPAEIRTQRYSRRSLYKDSPLATPSMKRKNKENKLVSGNLISFSPVPSKRTTPADV